MTQKLKKMSFGIFSTKKFVFAISKYISHLNSFFLLWNVLLYAVFSCSFGFQHWWTNLSFILKSLFIFSSPSSVAMFLLSIKKQWTQVFSLVSFLFSPSFCGIMTLYNLVIVLNLWMCRLFHIHIQPVVSGRYSSSIYCSIFATV